MISFDTSKGVQYTNGVTPGYRKGNFSSQSNKRGHPISQDKYTFIKRKLFGTVLNLP